MGVNRAGEYSFQLIYDCTVNWVGGFRSLGITSVARVSTIEQICGGIDQGQSAPVCTELTLLRWSGCSDLALVI